MNLKIVTLLREACAAMPARGIEVIRGGPWYVWDSEKIVGADPIGAAILMAGKLPPGLTTNPESLVRPGLVQAACELLNVDPMWLYRFWMGYDRRFQIMVISKDQESRDEVSEFGIFFAKEIFREDR
jgi:hypothetical protein